MDKPIKIFLVFLTCFCCVSAIIIAGIMLDVIKFEKNDYEKYYIDPVIQEAEPYINKIVSNDIELRAYANSIIGDCPANDKECQINAIYRHVVEQYNYLSDPADIELIQTPQETMQIKGGDCEDLAILLNSLLENIGIETYLVLADTHAYSLAYDVDTNYLWNYVEESLINQVEKDWGEDIRQYYDSTFVLDGYYNWYYGGDGSTFEGVFDYMDITYNIESNEPLHFYVVPSQEDFDLLTKGETFTHYPDFEEENVLTINGVCSYLDCYGGIILCNDNWEEMTIHVNLTFYFHPSFYELFENETIMYYEIDNRDCVVLDPTAGEYGYPGYDGGLTGEKIAIDPVTKEYLYLE